MGWVVLGIQVVVLLMQWLTLREQQRLQDLERRTSLQRADLERRVANLEVFFFPLSDGQ